MPWLIACATPPAAPRVELIEVPGPAVIQPVPDNYVQPLSIPHQYPAGPITNADIEARLLACEATVDRANTDRAWIKNRQNNQ